MKVPEENRGIPALREIVEERKGKAIEKLSATYAENRLPLEEYERLVEYINKIESERELAVVEKIVAEYSAQRPDDRSLLIFPLGTGDETSADNDDDETDNPPDINRSSINNLTVLSTRTFSGKVKSGAQYLSILGSGQINIRKEDLQRKQTVLNIVSILGDCTINVEGGIRVTNRVVPILANADLAKTLAQQEGSGDQELVISGTAILGNISVKLLKE